MCVGMLACGISTCGDGIIDLSVLGFLLG